MPCVRRASSRSLPETRQVTSGLTGSRDGDVKIRNITVLRGRCLNPWFPCVDDTVDTTVPPAYYSVPVAAQCMDTGSTPRTHPR